MGASTYSTETVEAQIAQPANGSGYGWAVAAASGWLVGGLWLDAWAHHNLPAALETPFTPWHGVLYAGFLALAALLVAAPIRNRVAGSLWRQAVPAGYGPSLLGVLIFIVGGVADMAWHLLFGIEVGIEALLSPSHLTLALGAVLMVSGPLQAAWSSAPGGRANLVPALLSLSLTLSVLTFFTEYANPFNLPWPARWFDASTTLGQAGEQPLGDPRALGQALGITSILLQAALLTGGILLAVRRWSLPFGAVTLILTLNVGLSVVSHAYYLFVPAAMLAGLAADLLLWRLGPSPERPKTIRIFAFSIPAVLYALYFLTLALTGGVSWPVELWAGSILLAGAVGVLLSYLTVPPSPAMRHTVER